ncbi:MAG: cbb3-type cytochrome oxidase assembly protein CcoS [Burkholderiales bacterium]|jgi:cbb3-type cytochrome oxidase maturation protein|nr:cbb3-type cytochrome oxidase assembly protein CcoS [Burkholderiales bacterium]
MEILWLLIPMSVLLVLVMGCIFWWSVRSGQFDDLDGPAYRILVDDDSPTPEMAPGEALAAEKDREGG